MSESAVLFHSYSFAAPRPQNDSHEENPIHALSESVSFGRFMTENLEWGKWSSFSHKKYVDEAEKFSQPGSVAQKKAFFEAHYKRIADAKKAKASDESSPLKQQQQPESVAVLLNTLETLTKDEVKEDETELVSSSEELVLSIEKDDKPERESGVVLEQEEESGVVLEQKDDAVVRDEMEVKENHTEDGVLLIKSPSVGEKEEERRSVTKTSSATSEAPAKANELEFSLKLSERPIAHSSMKENKKPVRRRFSFLNCLMGNTKTQDQNATRKKRKTDKKANKPFLCLCFKPQITGETEAPIRRRAQRN